MTAGVCLLASSSSVRQSSTYFCSWITAIYNSIFGEHSLSVPPSSCGRLDISLFEYSTSGGLSAWLSGMSLPDVVLSGPSDVNKARFRGISHRLSLCATVSSGIRLTAGRPPALLLRPAGCSVRRRPRRIQDYDQIIIAPVGKHISEKVTIQKRVDRHVHIIRCSANQRGKKMTLRNFRTPFPANREGCQP